MGRETQWDTLDSAVVACRKCPRLVAWREEVAEKRRRAYMDWEYWGKPVPGFGDRRASVLVVGLAPGAHGANRTGRMFTGDGSGDFLYGALHRARFASQPTSRMIGDGLELNSLFISAVCRCAPPGNKPTPQEIGNCLPYLEREYDLLQPVAGVVALGKIAFDNTIRLLRQKGLDIPRLDFSHAAHFTLGENLPWIIASYHPSRQNTQTGRLTQPMFDEIWSLVKKLLDEKTG
ncbi:MAG: uracil-DNA glycosylase [Anaerolineales bacterium]